MAVYILILKNGIVFTFMEVPAKECRSSKFLKPRVTHSSKKVPLHWERHRSSAEEGGQHPPVQLTLSVLAINKRQMPPKGHPHQPYSHLLPLVWPPALDWSLLQQRFVVFSPLSLLSPPDIENVECLIDWQAFIQETILSVPDEQRHLEMISVLCTGKAISLPFLSPYSD